MKQDNIDDETIENEIRNLKLDEEISAEKFSIYVNYLQRKDEIERKNATLHLKEIIKSETDKTLEMRIRQFCDNDVYILEIFSYLNSQQAREKLIEYIDNNVDITDEDISYVASELFADLLHSNE